MLGAAARHRRGGGFGASWALGENPPAAGVAAPVRGGVAEPAGRPGARPAARPDHAAPSPRGSPGAQTVGQRRLPDDAAGAEGLGLLRELAQRVAVATTRTSPTSATSCASSRCSATDARSTGPSTSRIDELNEDESNVEILDQTRRQPRTSRFVTSNHLRHGYLTWLDLTGSDNAQVEIAVTGREVDDAGMADLIARVAAGIELG